MRNIRNQLDELQIEYNQKYPKNEIGLAQLFYDLYHDRICYVIERKQWYIYDGSRWIMDSNALFVMEFCKEFVSELTRYAMDKDNRELLKFVSKLTERKKREFLIRDARSIQPKTIDDFDKTTYLFNCKNGTFNLKTFKLQPHNYEDYITQLADVIYNEDMICQRWLEFVDEITLNDKKLTCFIQQMFGYCLSGMTDMECLFILYGETTLNGKSAMVETIGNILGDYFKVMQPESISKYKRNGSAPTPDTARLKSARMVNVSDPEKELKLNSSYIKQLTGGDTISGRHLHEEIIQFKPEFKLLIHTNHLPKIDDNSMFASSRIHIIPFDRHFKTIEQDTTLKTVFKEENSKSGILNWMLEGYRLLLTHKLKPTERMQELIKEYENESDVFELFANECLIKTANVRMPLKEIYPVYVNWCIDNGYSYVSRNTFKREVKRKHEVKRNGSRGDELVNETLIGMLRSVTSDRNNDKLD